MNMNGQAASNRNSTWTLMALVMLALVAITMTGRQARGDDAPTAPAPATEKFVANVGGVDVGATLEIRGEATVFGSDIQLRQICRWADADSKYFAPLADLTIARFQGQVPFQAVSIDEIRQVLHDSGANLGLIRFAGSINCTVARSDVKYSEADALKQWVDAREGKVKAAAPMQAIELPPAAPATRPLAMVSADALPAADATVHTMRDRILADASIRLNVPSDLLQVNFNPADDHYLNLSEPQFRFNLEARRVWGLGEVAWDVLIVTESGNNKKVPILATVRAWQKQIVMAKPVAYKQVIQGDDIIEKRILVDHLPDDPLLTRGQVLGQEAARDLKPGTILTSKLVSPVALAKTGQFITVTMVSGNVHVKTVGRAMESGSYGQTVKVKNEATNAIYEVQLTGPQEGTISPP